MTEPSVSQVRILRADGEREDHIVVAKGTNLLRWIREKIGADCTDTVRLPQGRVMIVDDNGWETETIDHGNGRIELRPIRPKKPINNKATELYWAVCKPVTTHQIAGDVAITLDANFA